MNPRKSVLEIVQSTTGYFKKHGIESPRLNAELMLAHVLKIKRMDLYMGFEKELGEEELAPLRELMRRRVSGVPLQHLLGTVEFFGRVFKTDSRALIPRPETERLVEILLPLLRENGRTIADVGTGTGIIALTIASELPEAEVWAIDLSPDALELAKENATLLEAAPSPRKSSPALPLGVEATLPSPEVLEPSPPSVLNLHFFESDLLKNTDLQFDWIIANLPYIPTGDLPGLSREVQCDPVGALDGGPDGLDLIRRLIEQAPNHLHPNGGIALEIGHDQSEKVADLLADANFRDIRVEKDYQGISRFLIARHG